MSTTNASRPDRPARPACCHKADSRPGYPAITTASIPEMSTPNSRAFVATTARIEPSCSLASIRRRSSGRYPARYAVTRAPLVTRSWAWAEMTSASEREATKQIVCNPASVRSATSPVASVEMDSAGCHKTTSRPGCGEQSSSTTSTFSTPSRRVPASAAFVEVALESRNTGSAPCIRQSLRSRRITWATCAPKTPRYWWASSMTTYRRLPSNPAHRA